MDWLQTAKDNLLSCSSEQMNFRKALEEWHYTGNCFDLEDERTNCQLCAHPDIRYQFEVENSITDKFLYVGSECIHKFDIRAIDSQDRRESSSDSRKRVSKDRHKLIEKAREKRVIEALIRLRKVGEDFDIDSFIDYLRERGAFTPNQLNLVLWRLGKNKITHNVRDFKLTIRRQREKYQLQNLETWKLSNIWEAMSKSQQDWYYENSNADWKKLEKLLERINQKNPIKQVVLLHLCHQQYLF